MQKTKKILVLLAALFLTANLFAQNEGKKITVSFPITTGLENEEVWIPYFIQGQLTADIENYSDFIVIDRLAASKLIDNQDEKAKTNLYDDNSIRYAKYLAADYVVVVNFIKKDINYSINAKVISVRNSKLIGKVYTRNKVTLQELKDGLLLHNIAYELLMGLEYDEKKYNLLLSESDEIKATVQAQLDLALGIAAEQNGMTMEAMTYYLKAASNDKNLKEASDRLSNTSKKVRAKNENQKNQWITLFSQIVDNLEKNPPFMYVYDEEIKPLELTAYNYSTNTMSFQMNGTLVFSDEWKIITKLKENVSEIDNSDQWGQAITNFPLYQASDNSWLKRGTIFVDISLKDENNNVIKSIRQSYFVDYKNLIDNNNDIFEDIPLDSLETAKEFVLSIDNITFEPEKNKSISEKLNIPIITMNSGKPCFLGINFYGKEINEVNWVFEKSPAGRAGLQKGDRIVGLDSAEFSDIDIKQFLYNLRFDGKSRGKYDIHKDYKFYTLTPGDIIHLLIMRDGEFKTIEIKMADGDECYKILSKYHSLLKQNYISDIKKNAMLGITYINYSNSYREITEIVPGSLADKNGFKIGDVITKFEIQKKDQPNESYDWDKFKTMKMNFKEGDVIIVFIQRDFQKIQIPVTWSYGVSDSDKIVRILKLYDCYY